MKTRIGNRLDFYDITRPTTAERLQHLAESFQKFAAIAEASAQRMREVNRDSEEGRGGHDSDDPIRYPTLHHGGV